MESRKRRHEDEAGPSGSPRVEHSDTIQPLMGSPKVPLSQELALCREDDDLFVLIEQDLEEGEAPDQAAAVGDQFAAGPIVPIPDSIGGQAAPQAGGPGSLAHTGVMGKSKAEQDEWHALRRVNQLTPLQVCQMVRYALGRKVTIAAESVPFLSVTKEGYYVSEGPKPSASGYPTVRIPYELPGAVQAGLGGKEIMVHALMYRFQNDFREVDDWLSHIFKPGVDIETGLPRQHPDKPLGEGKSWNFVTLSEAEDILMNRSRAWCHKASLYNQAPISKVLRCSHWPPCRGPGSFPDGAVCWDGQKEVPCDSVPIISAGIADYAMGPVYYAFRQARIQALLSAGKTEEEASLEWPLGIKWHRVGSDRKIPHRPGGGRSYQTGHDIPGKTEDFEIPGLAP